MKKNEYNILLGIILTLSILFFQSCAPGQDVARSSVGPYPSELAGLSPSLAPLAASRGHDGVCGVVNDPENPDEDCPPWTPPENLDEPPNKPCDKEEEADSVEIDGDEYAGDGLFLGKAKGNVRAIIPAVILEGEDSANNVILNYDSVKAGDAGPYEDGRPIGYGWSHSLNNTLWYRTHPLAGRLIRWCKGGAGTAKCRVFVFEPSAGHYLPRTGGGRKLEEINGGRNVLVTRADGRRYLYASSTIRDFWQIKQFIDARGRTSTYVYGEEGGYGAPGQLQRVITAHGREILFQYNEAGRLRKVIAPNGSETELTYTDEDVSSITDAMGNTIQYDYDDQHRITHETLQNGTSYSVEYEENSRTLFDSQNNIIARISSELGFPTKSQDPIWPGLVNYQDGRDQEWQIWRNHRGQITTEVSPNNQKRIWFYGGPGSGPNHERLIAYQNENGGVQWYDWGFNGEVLKRTDEQNNVEEFHYDLIPFEKSALLKNRTRPDGEIERWHYDPQTSDLLIFTNANQDSITYEYETWDEMEGLPSGWDEPLPGRVKSVRVITNDANNQPHATKFDYNAKGDLSTVTRAEGELNLVTRIESDDMGKPEAITMERGDRNLVLQMIWDDAGRLTDRIVDPGGLNLTTHIERDDLGLTDTVRNPKNVVTDYNYDHRNRLQEIIKAQGSLNLKTEYELDGEGNIKILQNANGQETIFTYNEQNYLVQINDAEGFITKMQRDGEGQIIRSDRGLLPGEDGPFTSVVNTYDLLGRLLSKTIDPEGARLTKTFEYNTPEQCPCGGAIPGTALPHLVEDAEGKLTFAYYDKLNRLTKIVQKVADLEDNGGDNDDAISEFFYDPMGNLLREVGPEGEEVLYHYDPAYRLKQVIQDPMDASLVTTILRDKTDNPRTVTLPNGNVKTNYYDASNRLMNISDSLGPVASFTYTPTNQIKTQSDALGHTIIWDYDPADRPILVEAPGEEISEYVWDPLGQMIETIDPMGIVTHNIYNNLGQIEQSIRNFEGQGPTANTTTEYAYNGAGWLRFQRDHNGNTTEYTYDKAGRIEETRYPDGSQVRLWLNGVGNVIKRKKPDQSVTEYLYNDLHQKTQTLYVNRSELFSYDKSGFLLSTSNQNASSHFDYDGLGRLVTAQQTIAGNSFESAYHYIIGPESTATRIGPVRNVTHSTDLRGRIYDIYADGNIGVTFTFDADDMVSQVLTRNGVLTALNYDENDRLIRLQHQNAAGRFFDEVYGYDDAGRRSFTEDLLQSNRSSLAIPDALGRLTQFERGTLSNDYQSIETPLEHELLAANISWGLDARGNWQAMVKDNVPEVRSFNGVNELQAINGQSLAYDHNGNLTVNPIAQQRYQYDEENRLVRVTNWSGYAILESDYDSLGRRVETRDYAAQNPPCGLPQITRIVYDGLSPMVTEEYVICNGQAILMRETIPGPGFPNALALINHPSGQVLYLQNDTLGSPIAITDASGATLERYAYDPYGKRIILEGN